MESNLSSTKPPQQDGLTIAVAPMMAYTDTYFRTLLQCINPQAVLYTEMICAEAILRKNDWREMLVQEARQANLVIQVGGSCVERLTKAAERISEVGGFAAINLTSVARVRGCRPGVLGLVFSKSPS